jgi:hypothetical protein
MDTGLQRTIKQEMDSSPRNMYDHMRHNLPTSETFPKRCTGPIWIVAQLNYYNINRWQIRNEAAHATESVEEYRRTREMHHSIITALYQLNSTDPDPHALYRQPLEDNLNMSNERLANWLQSHSAFHHTEQRRTTKPYSTRPP